jgi:hypothetical protein
MKPGFSTTSFATVGLKPSYFYWCIEPLAKAKGNKNKTLDDPVSQIKILTTCATSVILHPTDVPHPFFVRRAGFGSLTTDDRGSGF